MHFRGYNCSHTGMGGGSQGSCGRGSTLVITLLISTIFIVLCVSLCSYVIAENDISGNAWAKHQAFYLADSGVRYAQGKIGANYFHSGDDPVLFSEWSSGEEHMGVSFDVDNGCRGSIKVYSMSKEEGMESMVNPSVLDPAIIKEINGDLVSFDTVYWLSSVGEVERGGTVIARCTVHFGLVTSGKIDRAGTSGFYRNSFVYRFWEHNR